jgi:hypothetical protein
MIAVPFVFIAWGGIATNAEARGLVTNEVSHTVKRSDRSDVAEKRNGFRGGSHKYFPKLGKKIGWLGDLNMKTFKKGWARLYLDWPVRISSIVIHKASVGKKDFKEGYIVLEVQIPKGKWIKVFERKDDDIDRAVTIRKAVRSVGPVKGVRIRFNSPQPITVGPIDLNS